MWAIFITELGNHSSGIKAPHRNAEPSATTFTIPLTATLLLTNELINNDNVKQLIVNTNSFPINNKPLIEKSSLPNIINPSKVYKIYTTIA